MKEAILDLWTMQNHSVYWIIPPLGLPITFPHLFVNSRKIGSNKFNQKGIDFLI